MLGVTVFSNIANEVAKPQMTVSCLGAPSCRNRNAHRSAVDYGRRYPACRTVKALATEHNFHRSSVQVNTVLRGFLLLSTNRCIYTSLLQYKHRRCCRRSESQFDKAMPTRSSTVSKTDISMFHSNYVILANRTTARGICEVSNTYDRTTLPLTVSTFVDPFK